ncbi:hypothetical protein E5288_WYG019556 [Bos mutus]|uniref:Uncharacterized protein n=1 Tax=Bos mutus TaxID=72004 RepID=A0A6B0RUZ9_9CETA|nr:hypothetical protein [Bos mutus]
MTQNSTEKFGVESAAKPGMDISSVFSKIGNFEEKVKGKERLPARVGHAVRCRLPSALTFAAEAVAEAAAAMFPC